jgi:protein involved in polysaccharide export with SLBB domain
MGLAPAAGRPRTGFFFPFFFFEALTMRHAARCASGSILFLLLLGAAVVVATPAHAQKGGKLPAASVQQDTVAPRPTVLRPGDVVSLKVFREPDLTGDFRIDETGTVIIPHIGPIAATTVTPDSLRALIVATYSKYLRDPAITVTFTRRVSVLGEVKNPGLYQADPTQTVADLIAAAGGVTPDGRRDRVDLIRNGKQFVTKLTPDEPLITSPVQSGDQLYIEQRSWIARNPYVVGALIAAVISGAATIIAVEH